MNNKEIQYFTEGFKLASKQFYIDSMHKFQELVDEFPESDLADDALYNIGLCYFEMNQFQQCIDTLLGMIKKYPDATITSLEESNAFGRTAAKAYYLILQCHLGLNDIQSAEAILPKLDLYTDTYILVNDQKIFFSEIAQNTINKYKSIF